MKLEIRIKDNAKAQLIECLDKMIKEVEKNSRGHAVCTYEIKNECIEYEIVYTGQNRFSNRILKSELGKQLKKLDENVEIKEIK